MYELGDDANVAPRVLFAAECEGDLSVLPSIVGQAQDQLEDPAEFAAALALSPGLAVALWKDAAHHGASGSVAPLERLVSQWDTDQRRWLLLRVDLFSAQPEVEASTLAQRVDLIEHCVAVALVAERLAERLHGPSHAPLAYLAGLLHDAGKLVFQQAMPQGYGPVLEGAGGGAAFLTQEQRRLGTDHTILGQRLLRKWGVPPAVVQAAWLHHLPERRRAQLRWVDPLVHCVCWANELVHAWQCGDLSIEPPAGCPRELVEPVISHMAERLEQVTPILRADQKVARQRVLEEFRVWAGQLACQRVRETRQRDSRPQGDVLQKGTELVERVLQAEVPDTVGVCSQVTRWWQQQLDAPAVGLIVRPVVSGEPGMLILQGPMGRVTCSLLEIPAEAEALWKRCGRVREMLDAEDHFDWLFCQSDVSLDIELTRWCPLVVGTEVQGVLFCEQPYGPDGLEDSPEMIRMRAVAAGLIAWTRRLDGVQRWLEAMTPLGYEPSGQPEVSVSPDDSGGAGLREGVEPTQSVPVSPETGSSWTEGLGEMVAGFAHELNNPLAVIAGRAELLTQAEVPETLSESLRQILENTREVVSLLESLMRYAEPTAPRPVRLPVDQWIRESLAMAGTKLGLQDLQVQVDLSHCRNTAVWGDSAQWVSCLANIVVNAVESYGEAGGPVHVEAQDHEDTVTVTVRDQGCGIAPEDLPKVCYPFFSRKTAGRQRGMGLAYAQRFAEINDGRLEIRSTPGEGTVVTVTARRCPEQSDAD